MRYLQSKSETQHKISPGWSAHINTGSAICQPQSELELEGRAIMINKTDNHLAITSVASSLSAKHVGICFLSNQSVAHVFYKRDLLPVTGAPGPGPLTYF